MQLLIVNESQCGFRRGRSTINNDFCCSAAAEKNATNKTAICISPSVIEQKQLQPA